MAGNRYGRRWSDAGEDNVGDYPMVDLENGRASKANISSDNANERHSGSNSPPPDGSNQRNETQMADGSDQSETLLLPTDVHPFDEGT